MITRIRERDEGGFRVTIETGEGVVAERTTPTLAEAFLWQAHIQRAGEFPAIPVAEPEPEPVAEPVAEPEVIKAKGKKK